MAVVKCPECGSRTVLRTSYMDDSRYYVCINYPDCRGRVPVEDGILTDTGAGKSAGKPLMDNLRRQRDEPPIKGMVLADEPPTNIWNKDDYSSRAASNPPQRKKTLNIAAGAKKAEFSKTRWPGSAEAAEYRARQQGTRSASDGGAPRAARVPVKVERGPARGAYSSFGRRDTADPSWGDDWDDDSPASKTAPERPSRRAVVEKESPAGEKKPLATRRRKALKEDVSVKKKAPETRRKEAPKAVPVRPRRPQEPELVDDEFKQMGSSEEDVSPVKKKPSPVVIIIALVVAFLAIDGIIFAAIKLMSE